MQVDAKVKVCESYKERVFWTGIEKAAKSAVKLAKAAFPHDVELIGTALYTLAWLYMQTNFHKACGMTAKQALRCFEKLDDPKKTAYTYLLMATSDQRGHYYPEARNYCAMASNLFRQLDDNDGMGRITDIEEQIDIAEGRPTQAQIKEYEEKYAEYQYQLQMAQQQQMMQMMQMQGGGMMPQQQMQMAPPDAGGDMPTALATSAAPRDRTASPLKMSAGMDIAVVKTKIQEVASSIIGDTDDIEADTPLMEAGLTSNSAVLLRDELTKDLPGIPLPPTLIFDYPSIQAISDYVVEKSQNMK
jgi:acyl carrier protein